jgi:hypothetical protein
MQLSCNNLIRGFHTAVADVHFQKLRLQEERWIHSFAGE